MIKVKLKGLIAKLAIFSIIFSSPIIMPFAYAGIPVIDGGNLVNNIVTAIENVGQTLQQIQQYKTQLEQYENMLENTTSPSSFTWDQATTTMNQLRGSIDTLDYYKTNLGSIDSYLDTFQDTSQYRNSPCFSVGGCTETEWAALLNSQNLGSEAQKRSTDALFKGLDKQQDAMVDDAQTLQRLQSSAQGANGQAQAIGYANQLASQQANQLLQIRGLLIAEQNVMATRNQALANREAQRAVASEQLRQGSFVPSPQRNW